MTIRTVLNKLLNQPSGPYLTIREFKLFPFIKYFLNTKQNVKMLEEAPSGDSIKYIREQLNQSNLQLGSPVKITKAIDDMSYEDWLDVHLQLVQYKIMHTGTKRLNQGVLLSDKKPRLPSLLLKPYFFTGIHSLITISLGIALFFIMGLIPVPITNEEGKLVWEALPGPIRLMMAMGIGIATVGLGSLFLRYRDHQTHLKSLGDPSSTWQEVFKLQTSEDALLLHMIEELNTVDIAWGDLTPQEAMDICLKLQNEDSSSTVVQLQKEWSTISTSSQNMEERSTTTAQTYIPVKVPKQRSSCNPNLNMNELANSFLCHSEKQRGGNTVE